MHEASRPTAAQASWQPSQPELPGFQCIRHVDALPPFLMSVVSNGDGWMFVTSAGVLTAGRVSPERACFPYQTADKLLERPDVSGAWTLVRPAGTRGEACWEPWCARPAPGSVDRVLHKSHHHSEIIFEETHAELGLRLTARLGFSAAHGLVRCCTLEALTATQEVELLDGWRTLHVPGVSAKQYATLGYLAEAYLRHELCPETGLGIFALNARIIDRPQAAESLRATAAWSVGLPTPIRLLSRRQVDAFRAGERVQDEPEIRGELGCHLSVARVTVRPNSPVTWTTAVDTWLGHTELVALRAQLKTDPAALAEAAGAGMAANTAGLRARIAAADALQATADESAVIHHEANVLFNCLRGGLPVNGFRFALEDVRAYLRERNRPVATRHEDALHALPATYDRERLLTWAAEQSDPDLVRLCTEYLPLAFSRRHGDPSRPWNTFTIQLADERGQPRLGYEGNWRDIFQNWEALAFSYPGWIESMATVFLNASTADGYNPYRITRSGIEWEVEDPDDPWSHIGYWGDHQIIYLSRLLEAWEHQDPSALAARWRVPAYVCVEVPYRHKAFALLCTDPHDAISFDQARHDELLRRAAAIGGDGKLLAEQEGRPHRFTLAEKLLVPVLVKLANLVPGGGIWMNTQRPEWNDANNALAGWGLSVVTTAHMHRHLSLLHRLATAAGPSPVPLCAASAALLRELRATLEGMPARAAHEEPPRRALMESLGLAGERHRNAVYAGEIGQPTHVGQDEVLGLLAAALRAVEATLEANRREDGLFHSYNVLSLGPDKAAVRRLDLMLEGQVAVLGTSWLAPAAAADILDRLAQSALYRADQHSYLLYPDRELKPFLERNTLPSDAADNPLLAALVRAGDVRLVSRDCEGRLHFQADLSNTSDLRAVLDRLAADPAWAARVREQRAGIEQLWEETFHHALFTGRSTTFFAFEGLGSIYWHMVAKLMLAAQEQHRAAHRAGDYMTAGRLAAHYERIQDGLGYRRSPASYGAFPPDPYSHTPRHRGAQQPGMTGQVKEEILARWGELGLSWEGGCLRVDPTLLRKREFLSGPAQFAYLDGEGCERVLTMKAGSLAFTLAQIPVVFQRGNALRIKALTTRGPVAVLGGVLPKDLSQALRTRNGTIGNIVVDVPDTCLR